MGIQIVVKSTLKSEFFNPEDGGSVPLNDGNQWRTEEGGLGCSNPPAPRNSEDIGGVLKHMSKKNRHLDFLLQFTVFS